MDKTERDSPVKSEDLKSAMKKMRGEGDKGRKIYAAIISPRGSMLSIILLSNESIVISGKS